MPGAGPSPGGGGMPPPPPAAPAPAMAAGYPAPPGGGGYAPPPQPPNGPAAFTSGANDPIPLSPWAAMAPAKGMAPPPAPQPMQSQPMQGYGAPPAPQGYGAPPQPMMAPSIGLAPPPSPGFGAPPGPAPVAAYPAPGAFGPPPGVPQQMMTGGLGAAPVTGAGPVAPPPLVGLVSGAPIAPPPPPMINQPPMVSSGMGLGGFAPPPPVVGPPPPVPPAALQPSPGVLSGPAALMPQQTAGGSNGILVGFLVTFQNEPNGVFWPIRSGRTQLGRAGSDKVDIGINDASASSKHASVSADPSTGQAFVQDDGSRNGTFLNEQKLNPGEQRQLHDNDRLRLGSTTLVIKLLVS